MSAELLVSERKQGKRRRRGSREGGRREVVRVRGPQLGAPSPRRLPARLIPFPRSFPLSPRFLPSPLCSFPLLPGSPSPSAATLSLLWLCFFKKENPDRHSPWESTRDYAGSRSCLHATLGPGVARGPSPLSVRIWGTQQRECAPKVTGKPDPARRRGGDNPNSLSLTPVIPCSYGVANQGDRRI